MMWLGILLLALASLTLLAAIVHDFERRTQQWTVPRRNSLIWEVAMFLVTAWLTGMAVVVLR